MLHYLVVASDHFQVLVADAKRGPKLDTSCLWDSANGVASLPHAPQLIAIPTVRYGGNTSMELELLHGPPEASYLGDWQRIGAFLIEIESGELLFWGPETIDLKSVPRIMLDAGTYNGIAYSYGTAQVNDEMDAEGPDKYRICMWPKL